MRSPVQAAVLAAVLLPLPLAAQTAPVGPPVSSQAESGQPPKRIRSILLTGNERCPTPANPSEEIVVCARQGEPYRIPKELRNTDPVPAQNQSWVNRAATMDEVGRRAGGLPDTCSPTGTGGQSGCAKLRAEQYAAEKRASGRERNVP